MDYRLATIIFCGLTLGSLLLFFGRYYFFGGLSLSSVLFSFSGLSLGSLLLIFADYLYARSYYFLRIIFRLAIIFFLVIFRLTIIIFYALSSGSYYFLRICGLSLDSFLYFWWIIFKLVTIIFSDYL